MSKITSIYDDIVTKLSALLPNHTRLPNGYKIEENPSIFTCKGFGVAVLDGENTNRTVSCIQALRRNFQFSITREYNALENDAAKKADTEKALLEDLFIIFNDVEKDPTLNDSVSITKYVSDSGIQYVETETDKFYMIQGVFTVEYFEHIT